ncbi:MAG: hypothetical protein ACOYJQ_16600 [Pseudochelatococcus sp.]|jgi:hypothetical protein|uniref:hypothetical protein n=1 Tax=Pseudochelatococcus sp. TaxID=2020869 RepID=UPI003D948DB1
MTARVRFAFLACLVLTGPAHATRLEALDTRPAAVQPPGSVPETPAVPLISPPDAGASAGENGDAARTPDASRATLAPPPADASRIDAVEIAPRTTLVLSLKSSWEKGFESLAAAFRLLDEIAIAAGFDVTGRPFAVFTRTDDDGFGFDAMLPVSGPDRDTQANADAAMREALAQAVAEHAAADGGKDENARAVRLGAGPSGKAYRFVHASPYDDIDTTYEAVTAWLDSRNIAVRDAFIEEYVSDLTEPTDEALEVYVYVQPVDGPAGEGTAPDEDPLHPPPAPAQTPQPRMPQSQMPQSDAPQPSDPQAPAPAGR